MTIAIDLAPKDLHLVKEILHHYLPTHEIWVFGSRIEGRAKPFSDLDLVIKTETPMPLSVLAEVAEALSESVLPIRVDILDWSRLSDGFKHIILKNYMVLQSPVL